MPERSVTQLLMAWREGELTAKGELYTLLYQDLKQIARQRLGRLHGEQTLSATELVHESFLKLVRQEGIDWQDRLHFLSVSAIAMRQILIDRAKKRLALKRAGDWKRVTFTEGLGSPESGAETFLAWEQALSKLESLDERAAKGVVLRWFGGLTQPEIAQVLEVDERTVRRDWKDSQAFLKVALSELMAAG